MVVAIARCDVSFCRVHLVICLIEVFVFAWCFCCSFSVWTMFCFALRFGFDVWISVAACDLA